MLCKFHVCKYFIRMLNLLVINFVNNRENKAHVNNSELTVTLNSDEIRHYQKKDRISITDLYDIKANSAHPHYRNYSVFYW